MRLDKMLAHLGLGTRAQVKSLLAKGHVSLDGVLARDGALHVKEGTPLVVDGQTLVYLRFHYIMMNKPQGVISATQDQKATVLDLLPPLYLASGCAPVGRLDKDACGLLLITNDGALTHRLLSPKKEVKKTYEVTVEGAFTQEDVARFAIGLDLGDFTSKPALLEILESSGHAYVTVTEGKFHQVKRMCAAVGKPVLTLKRLSMGPLVLDETLSAGAYRALTQEEKRSLGV